MRRIVSCLIVGGLLASGPGIGISDDRSPSAPERTENAPSAPASDQAGVAPSPPEDRDYSEIFGQRGSGQAAEQPSRAPETPSSSTDRPQGQPRRGYTLSRSRQQPATTPAAPGVVFAEYERNDTDSSNADIEQVAATDAAPPSPTETTPGIPESGNTQDRLAQPVPTGIGSQAPAPRRQPFPAQPPIVDHAVPAAPVAAAFGPQTPSVSVEWRRTGDITIGREFECELVIQNQGTIAAQDLELTAFLPSHVRVVAANPEPTTTEGFLGWSINELASNEQRVYSITLLPQDAGEITTHAQVRFTGSASGRFDVAEPMLAIKLDGPSEVLVGEAATQVISVTNPGTGVTENVQIEALIPAGLEHVRGSRLLMDIGALHPGEVRTIRLPLVAVAGGMQSVQVQTRGGHDLAEIAAADIAVISPQLTTSISGPGLRYLGRHATYTLSVTNDGAVSTDNVQVMHKLPDGFELLSSNADVQFDDNLRLVNWHVGTLGEGETAQMEVTFDCEQIGEFTHFIRATSEHGIISDSSVQTAVEGVSSLVMEIHDLEDPVEVGTETIYEIQVTNEGLGDGQRHQRFL